MPTVRVGDDASDRQHRAILDFDTASLPAVAADRPELVVGCYVP